MEVKLYCIWCGGKLGVEDEHIFCFNCDTIYSNILLSESEVKKENQIIFEKSISIDCLSIKDQKNPSIENHTFLLESAAIYE
jgi:hypothetical protein